jgi:GNAT superfamily N-acetyltransferase
LDRQTIENFFAQGARVAVAELSDQVIGYQWVALETWAIYNWLCISIDPNSMWFTTAFVAPEFRGHDISPKLKAFVFQSLGAEGMDEAWGLVQFLNRSSIAALSKIGLRVVEKFVYLRLLGLTVVKIGPRWQANFWRASNRLVVPVKMFKGVPFTD